MTGSIEQIERRRALALLAPATLWTVLFFALPFGVMAAISLRRSGSDGWSLGNYAKFLGNPAYIGAFLNSLEITMTVTVLSVLLAYPLAWIIAEEIPPRYRRLALALAVLPFWTSYVVRSYAWSLVMAKQGVLNEAVTALGLPALALGRGAAGVGGDCNHLAALLFGPSGLSARRCGRG
jgi:spermidine/putrescine transport system permease protein